MEESSYQVVSLYIFLAKKIYFCLFCLDLFGDDGEKKRLMRKWSDIDIFGKNICSMIRKKKYCVIFQRKKDNNC